MKPITGTAVLTAAPATIAPAGPPPHTYLGVAASLLPAVRILASSDERPAIPIAMLSAHALECILKGYISRRGDDSSVRKRGVRHNLNALWSRAVADGLHFSSRAPDWVNRLSDLHNEPFHLRYSEKVHGVVLPAPEPMATELAAILEQVRSAIGSRGTASAAL
jgi:hypothetical protein